MKTISKESLAKLRSDFPAGTRVKLVKMDDHYNISLHPGEMGTVIFVDDIGTIHIEWDCGSSLGIVYDEDMCQKI